MMREYKRYDEFKDSGVEWIGEIPENWEISKYKFVAEMLNGYAFSSDDYTEKGVPVLRIGDIENNKDTNSFKKIPKEIAKELKDYEIEKEDILLALTGATIGKTSIFISDDKVLLNQRVGILRSNQNLVQNYLKYIIESNIFQTNINYLAYGGAQENIGKNDIYNMFITRPFKKEQQKIASFLDQKTAEIDEIITKKEKLIDSLEKYKKSVITEAVTKGKLGDKYINADGELVDEIEMKDSGVEWIGEIPEYWDVSKIKHLLLDGNDGIRIGPFGSSLKLEEMNPNFPYKVYGQKHVINNNFRIGTRYINETKFKEMKRYEIFPEDILVTMMGTIGKCKVIPKEIKRGIIDSHLIRIRVNESKILSDFLALTIEKNHYTYEAMNYLSNGTVMSGLNSTIIKDLTVVLPSIENQKIIINYLNKKTEEIDNLIEKTKNSIKKYKEYKKSLIFEAVTGKIDLRGYELEGGEEIAEHNNSREIKREELSEVN